jgi:hypothetical protein
MAAVCDDLLRIETMVCDSRSAVLRLEDETKSVNQALRGLAHRPSPSYLAIALNRVGFDHVYAASDPPDHPDCASPGLTTWIRPVMARCREASSLPRVRRENSGASPRCSATAENAAPRGLCLTNASPDPS